MAVRHLIIDSVTYTYPNSIEPVFSELTAHFPIGWTGIVGANGIGKTTLLRIAAGDLQPQSGTVSAAGHVVLCSQRTDDPPERMPSFLTAEDAEAYTLRGQLGIEDGWGERWHSLSHGERKRIQIATALWQRPEVIIADEPTNHIDSDTKALLMRALASFAGIGIIVSHDRELLDTICRQCLFMDTASAVMRPGGYSQGIQEQKREMITHIREYQKAKSAYRKLKREVSNRRAEASQADRKRSKSGLSRKDHDARFKIDMARVTGQDGAAGRRMNQLAGRLKQAEQRLHEAEVQKEHTLGIRMPGMPARRDFLWHVPEGTLPLGDDRELHYPSLAMKPGDRVGITGANGTGKSTLIAHIVRSLDVPAETVVYIPQEITAEDSRQLIRDVRNVSRDTLGHIMELVSHLNSRPERLLQTDIPSPGEVRKLMLALGMQRDPYLIIMDEPTNHLDLPSIECLERALEQCSCGLLLVSHDHRFLEHTTDDEWRLMPSGDGRTVTVTNAAWTADEQE